MYITDLRDEDIEISVKVVIVGNGAVGKSSMIQRYCRGTFTKSYKKTIGVDFLEKQLRVHGEDVRLMLWDTAGQEEFDAITKAYYRGAQACVVAFSTTDRDSLLAVRKWRKKVEDECGDIPMVLVQNKIDLIAQSEINQSEAEALSRELNMRLYRTSVKDDLNVSVVFQHLAENYVNKVISSDSVERQPESLIIGKRKPSLGLELQFQNKFRLGNEVLPKQGRKNVIIRGKMIGGAGGRGGGSQSGVGGGNNNRYKQTRHPPHYSSYCDPCTDYLNSPMFQSLHSRGRYSNYSSYGSYWAHQDKTITLRPSSMIKRNTRPSCRVL